MKVRESVNWKHGYMSCQLLMMNLCDSFIIQHLVVINLLIIGKNSFKVLLEKCIQVSLLKTVQVLLTSVLLCII